MTFDTSTHYVLIDHDIICTNPHYMLRENPFHTEGAGNFPWNASLLKWFSNVSHIGIADYYGSVCVLLILHDVLHS